MKDKIRDMLVGIFVGFIDNGDSVEKCVNAIHKATRLDEEKVRVFLYDNIIIAMKDERSLLLAKAICSKQDELTKE